MSTKPPAVGITPKYLVVDDERIIADTITLILNQRGYPCVAAYDGDEAIQRARELHPKFILMNCFMPRMNGVDAAIRILKDQPECRICFMSGSFRRQHIDELAKGRLNDYNLPLLPKPFDMAELWRILSEWGFTPDSASDSGTS